jgi:hypothetical protein
MNGHLLFDRWREAQAVAAEVVRGSAGPVEIDGPRVLSLPTPAELAGLDLAPARLDPGRFNPLRLELLRRLLLAGWPPDVIAEVCHAKLPGLRWLAAECGIGGPCAPGMCGA